jgi:hypothetical protein
VGHFEKWELACVPFGVMEKERKKSEANFYAYVSHIDTTMCGSLNF